MNNDAAKLFRLEAVSKRYGGITALNNASLAIDAGRIHAILGENGAGKSTLIKIMSGVVQPDEGRLVLDGREVSFANPASAKQHGIVCVFQELSLVPDLSVADNIFLDAAPMRFGLIDRHAQRRMTEHWLTLAGAGDIHPLALVKDLPLSRRQMVEIAKALARKPRILILDEATSALTAADVVKIFAVLKRLRAGGMALLYISHRMTEIDELADECTVFRNGRNIASFTAGSKSGAEIVQMMIGRDYNHAFPPKPPPRAYGGGPLLDVVGLSWTDRLKDITFSVRPGEVVGLGGLDGQGQSELLLALFGVLRGMSGDIRIDGKLVSISGPSAAKQAAIGMALIPEDRKTEGLMLPMSVRENLSLASLDRLSRNGVIDRFAEREGIFEMCMMLQIKTPSIDTPVAALSGGNQQKVVIAKWLMTMPRIILLNDPTRGIDVGTKQEIYALLSRLAATGAAIVLYSTDYDELIGCCDRVLVLYEGEIIREFVGREITESALVSSALNIPPDDREAGAAPAMSA